MPVARSYVPTERAVGGWFRALGRSGNSGAVDDSETNAALHAATESCVTFFDRADFCGTGGWDIGGA